MSQSVNISKITPPYLPQISDRPRLLNLLEKNRDKKLILILGQAAQGKSTLAACYVKSLKIPSAWINLDKEDSDPINLYYLIVHSLQRVLKEVDFSHLLSYSPQVIGPRAESPLYREWAQSIFKEVSIPIQIVIDGLNRLSTNALAFQFLQVLVEDSPPDIHLMLLSREMPPPVLEFQHLKMRQQALVLTNEALAFNRDEVKEFFQYNRKISFSSDQLRKIHSATEGWVGGLILFAESLSRFPEPVREKFISEDLPNHFKGEVFQYFGKEILSSQQEQVQEFLIKSSLIDLIEPVFMKDFLGMERAEEILRELVRKNLFVHSFHDEKKGWLFQYHHLFKDFLRAKFMASVGPEERKRLLLKAGTLYDERGELENSVKYFLEAKAYPRAALVIERLGIDLLKKGRTGDLAEWLLSLPNGTIQDNPWLLFYQAMIRRFMGGRENLVTFQKAYALFKQQGNLKGMLISLAQLIEGSIQTGIHLTPIESLIAEGEALFQQLELGEPLYERAVLWYSIGLGHTLGEGDIRKGIWACQNAYSIAKRLKDVSLQAYALCFLALGFVLLGEFSLADETQEKIGKLTEEGVYSEFRAIELMVQCLLANYRGDFDEARILVEKLQAEIEEHGFVYMVSWIYEISGYLMAAQREFSEAEKIGQEYLSTAISLGNGLFKGLAYRLLGLIYLYKNDFGKAREVIDQSMGAFSSEAPSKYHLNRARVQMGLVCTHLKEYGRAEKELGEALQYFSSISSYISLAEVHFAIAFLKHDQGKDDGAVSHLQQGFKIAREREYEYSYTLGMKYLTKACLLALELKVEDAVDYAAHLLSTRLSSVAEGGLEHLFNYPDLDVREEAWEIGRAIHRSKVPRLRIETLGRFQVFRGDSPIEENQWDRVQPKQLLKAIVSYGGRKIPKEILIDELWAEESPKAADKNFKTTLQRLRKSLEPSIHKYFSSSYIHLQDNFVFLDPELCQVDIDQFLSLLKRADEKEKRGDVKGSLSFYVEAMEIYKGDFLPDEIYASWADKKREELRLKYIEFLGKMASLYERQGTMKRAADCYKKVIQADPLLEESYQKLMAFYSSKGMYNEALRTYEDCKRALKRELETEPDPTTIAMHKKILEKIGSPPTTTRKGPGK
jgi:ATP/maltotriose-dependent transcriptional regulator MalT/DNA-binding SARP family transcriptional activator